MTTTVTALLVSHDGARWLPAVLEGLQAQTRAPERVLAVDTGSRDDGPALLRAALGGDAVLGLPARTSYGEAVRAGLAEAAGPGDEWVWLLHDDSNPAPDALERLLAAAADQPSADVLGCKLREWPSLRRLLEVGVTIGGTGRRETGLERGEYDQGQHDQVRDVLAVNTAGMLVRRFVLDELGLDPGLPVLGADLDLGWRAARAGYRTMVVPDAVVFHVEAAHRGVRTTELTGRRTRRAERRAALYTLLANCSPLVLPVQLVRLLLGSLLRALGLLLLRAPHDALDELAALGAVYLRPGRMVSARARRRRTARRGSREVRPLLAPVWMPYRHGLDLVGDVALAVAATAGEAGGRRRASGMATETGPVPDEAENLPQDTGLVARLAGSPAAWLFLVLVLLSAWAARGVVGAGSLSGGALLPAPDGAREWWQLYLRSWHDVGVGSGASTAPYVLPMALVSTVLLGKAWLLVDLLVLGAVPLAAWGAYRFLRLVTASPTTGVWGAAAYGLLPVLSGAVQQGRLGTVVAALVLPWLAHAAVFLAPGLPQDRRRRAAWRSALWLALLTAFVPLAWVLAAVLAVVAIVVGLVADRARWASPPAWGPVLLPLVVSAVLLLPWSVLTWGREGLASLVFEAGLPAPLLTSTVGPWEVVLGRPGSAGAPAWLSVGIAVVALVALLRADTRPAVLRAWTVLVAALGVAALAAAGTFTPVGSPLRQPAWLGLPLLVVQAAGICAAALAAAGVRDQLAGRSFGWRQPLGVAAVVLGLVTPLLGLGWWGVAGTSGPLDNRPPTDVPAYMTDAAAQDRLAGTLEIRGDQRPGFGYVLLRGPGIRLGQDSVLPTLDAQRSLTRLVSALASSPQPRDVDRLAAHGVSFVYLPRPADSRLVGNLDSVSGLGSGSATTPGARAWQVQQRPSGTALPKPEPSLRPWLLLVQGLTAAVALVLAAPTRAARR